MTKAFLLNQALKLSPRERDDLASRLFESLEEPFKADKGAEKLWLVEIKRRVAEVRSGNAKFVDADKLSARVRRKYGLKP